MHCNVFDKPIIGNHDCNHAKVHYSAWNQSLEAPIIIQKIPEEELVPVPHVYIKITSGIRIHDHMMYITVLEIWSNQLINAFLSPLHFSIRSDVLNLAEAKQFWKTTQSSGVITQNESFH